MILPTAAEEGRRGDAWLLRETVRQSYLLNAARMIAATASRSSGVPALAFATPILIRSNSEASGWPVATKLGMGVQLPALGVLSPPEIIPDGLGCRIASEQEANLCDRRVDDFPVRLGIHLHVLCHAVILAALSYKRIIRYIRTGRRGAESTLTRISHHMY